MKIGELIKELAQYDFDLDVTFEDATSGQQLPFEIKQKTGGRTYLERHPAIEIATPKPAELRDALNQLVEDINDLISESAGVSGFENGVITTSWNDLIEGSNSAWLGDSMRAAQEVLSKE